nr:MetaGeneMark_Unknown Function [uncultured bacterium]
MPHVARVLGHPDFERFPQKLKSQIRRDLLDPGVTDSAKLELARRFSATIERLTTPVSLTQVVMAPAVSVPCKRTRPWQRLWYRLRRGSPRLQAA